MTPPLFHPHLQPDNIREDIAIYGVIGDYAAAGGGADTDVAVAHDTTPFITAYPWTAGTGFGVKYANPATLPGGDGKGVAFCGNTDIAVTHFSSPRISAYPWTPRTGFGVKYANPATLPGTDIAFYVAYLRGGFWLS